MNKELELKIKELDKQIEFNNKIHCQRVAAKYERMKEALIKEYENRKS